MLKTKVKSMCNQPIYCNLPKGRSVKIPARSIVELEEADLQSYEIQLHQNQGNIIILETFESQILPQTEQSDSVQKAAKKESSTAKNNN